MSRSETLVITATDKAGHATSTEVALTWTSAVTQMMVGGTLRTNNPGDTGKTGYATAGRPKWNIVRTYNQGDALKALNTGWGTTVATSYTPTLGTGWSGTPSKVSALRSSLTALPDIPGIRVISFHEPEDNYGRTAAGAALYCQDEAVFEPMVRQVNIGRRNPLTPCRDFMAYSLQPAAWGTAVTARIRRGVRRLAAAAKVAEPAPELAHYHHRWLANAEMRVRRFVRRGLAKVRLATTPPDLSLYCAGMGDDVELGLDVYSINQIGLTVAFVKAQGKVGCVPEMGPLNAVPQNDPAITSYMQQGVPAFQSAGFSWLDWFDVNGAGADLDRYAGGLAYLKGQIAA